MESTRFKTNWKTNLTFPRREKSFLAPRLLNHGSHHSTLSKVLTRPTVSRSNAILLLLLARTLYRISLGIFAQCISIRFVALSSISLAVYIRARPTLEYVSPENLHTTQMRRANINLFPVERDRASAEFNRVWQLVVSQLVNGEAETTPVCSACPVPVSLLRFPPRCTDLSAPLLLTLFPFFTLFIPSLYPM